MEYKESEIVKNIKWKYKYSDSTKIPTKTSVTKIKELESENIISIEENMEQKDDSKQNIITDIPKFMQEEEKITGSKRGTLIHLCIQKMNEKSEYNKEKIEELIESLYKKDIITKKEKDSIDIRTLLNYTKSDLWNELKFAKVIKKEKPFYISVPAKSALNVNSDELILVQGIIDLYYIDKNDKLILVDYKTDYILEGEEEILVEKYYKQLELYKEALEKSLKRKVDKSYLFSTKLNKKIELKEEKREIR